MAVYLVAYDLHEGADYQPLIDAITRIAPDDKHWHCLDSTWLILHVGDALTIEIALKPYLPLANDRLLVAIMGKDDASWIGFDKTCSDWLSQNLM